MERCHNPQTVASSVNHPRTILLLKPQIMPMTVNSTFYLLPAALLPPSRLSISLSLSHTIPTLPSVSSSPSLRPVSSLAKAPSNLTSNPSGHTRMSRRSFLTRMNGYIHGKEDSPSSISNYDDGPHCSQLFLYLPTLSPKSQVALVIIC